MTSLSSDLAASPVVTPWKDHSTDEKATDAAKSSAKLEKLIVWDKNVPRSDHLRLFRQFSYAHPVGSVSDMAEVLDNGKKNKTIFDIVIAAGHGAPSFQGLGSGVKKGYMKDKDILAGHLGDIEKPLRVVQDCLLPREDRPSPVLFLSGCEVAKGKAALLKELSYMQKGVLIAASTDLMSPEETETEDETGNSLPAVVFQRLSSNHKISHNFLPEIVYSLNGEIVPLDKVKVSTGHAPDELLGDLLLHEKA